MSKDVDVLEKVGGNGRHRPATQRESTKEAIFLDRVIYGEQGKTKVDECLFLQSRILVSRHLITECLNTRWIAFHSAPKWGRTMAG